MEKITTISLEFLNTEREKIWARIVDLEDLVNKKTPEIEKEAKQHSRKAAEYKNKCFDHKNALDNLILDLNTKIKNIETSYNSTKQKIELINNTTETAKNCLDKIDSISEKIYSIDELYNNKDELEQKISELESFYANGKDSISKINAAFSNINKRKSEIDDLYYEIYGYDEEDPESEENRHIDGLKDQLEHSYKQIKDEVSNLRKELLEFRHKEKTEFNDELSACKESLNESIKQSDTEYNSILTKIKSLLPGALTTGLSHAYSEKRTAEIAEIRRSDISFKIALIGLVFVSIIPFGVSTYTMYYGKTLEAVILDTPRIVLSILPIYLPFLWLGYFSNKRINLSKRLVEEYTHKEVLSKTFEGLSSQIQEIDNDEISAELKIKLLYNVLDASQENPGKLISDYNKADHPIIDVLDKSTKLTDSLEKLDKIPGVKSLLKILDTKTEEIKNSIEKKVNDGLEITVKPNNQNNEAS
ncbi:hypothetical protein [Dickeya solani]|uniref:Chromosome partition protein Smc n=1 Tax=Dickeya solani TaxID=1089444 RepID=A0ABU4E9N2_9GAMM|nr:hypothetical protein [Dickeya solani]MCA6998747.1 hypothetical protein [Dickeya solani]MCZ0822198.1 hypothetical protein [Dickeya solani]MDV6994703.1 hypothetical protein [Dickeya solani]MDV7004082.1 hypothetical protein [Dickeya solani]MDV7039747.1 hypothetical protein [Dickeya solani]